MRPCEGKQYTALPCRSTNSVPIFFARYLFHACRYVRNRLDEIGTGDDVNTTTTTTTINKNTSTKKLLPTPAIFPINRSLDIKITHSETRPFIPLLNYAKKSNTTTARQTSSTQAQVQKRFPMTEERRGVHATRAMNRVRTGSRGGGRTRRNDPPDEQQGSARTLDPLMTHEQSHALTGCRPGLFTPPDVQRGSARAFDPLTSVVRSNSMASHPLKTPVAPGRQHPCENPYVVNLLHKIYVVKSLSIFLPGAP